MVLANMQCYVLDHATWTAVVHSAKLAWASQMGYVGAFGTNLHPDRVRAWADVLPNYKGIAQKAEAGGVNPYREVYGEAFTGECQCCEGGHIEDSAHVFQHCAGGAGDRGRMVRSVDYLWREAGLGRAWDTFRWVQEEGGGNIREYVGWEEWWGHVGHVPREGTEGIEQFCEGGQGAGRVKELALATGKIKGK